MEESNTYRYNTTKFIPINGRVKANNGFDYEEKVTALLSLKAQRRLDNFWLSSNMIDMQPLDDVIICTQENNKNVMYLFQIKHSEKKKAVTSEDLNELRNSGLNLHVYYEKFKIILTKIYQYIPKKYFPIKKIKIIIFTNRPVEEDDMFIPTNNAHLFNTNMGKVYKLNPYSFSIPNDAQFDSFLSLVHLHADQSDLLKLKGDILSSMEDFVNEKDSLTEDASNSFIRYIHNWMCITTEKYGLEKSMVEHLLQFSILQSYSIPIHICAVFNFNSKIRGGYLWDSIKRNCLSVNEQHLSYVKEMILREYYHFDETIWNDVSFFGQLLFEDFNNRNIKPHQKYILGCFFGDFALIYNKNKFTNFRKFPVKFISIVSDIECPIHLLGIDSNILLHLLEEEIALSCGNRVELWRVINQTMQLTISDVLTLLNPNPSFYLWEYIQSTSSVQRPTSSLSRTSTFFRHIWQNLDFYLLCVGFLTFAVRRMYPRQIEYPFYALFPRFSPFSLELSGNMFASSPFSLFY